VIKKCLIFTLFITTSHFLLSGDSETDEERKESYKRIVKWIQCCSCEHALDEAYCLLMEDLIKANLLPEDFKHYCCYCYFFEKVGLLHLRKYFYSWEIDENGLGNNICLEFAIPDSPKLKEYKYTITIHDYKKYIK